MAGTDAGENGGKQSNASKSKRKHKGRKGSGGSDNSSLESMREQVPNAEDAVNNIKNAMALAEEQARQRSCGCGSNSGGY